MASSEVCFELPVDSQNKATEFNPFKGGIHCGKTKQTNPHMRAFWAATLAFMFAFIGWFAFAPLMPVVRVDLEFCDNHADLMKLPESKRVKECKCKKKCKEHIGNANIAAVSFDVATRFMMGSVIEYFGPRLADCMLMAFGALVVGCSAGVVSSTGLIIARFFVSCLGSTFVVNQFWNSIMFNKSVVGTANATAGGWGNLGGGLTQTIMPLVYRFWHDGIGLPLSGAWRASMSFPCLLYGVLVPWIFFRTQDTPTGKFDVTILGKSKKAGFMDYVKCCSDYRVFLMIFQYSACFGCELVMNNILVSHFHDEFGVDLVAAGALAMSFGAMNLFARSVGGMLSDWANTRWQMTGRLWIHFLSLFFQAVALFAFGCIDKETGDWPVALVVLVIFAIFVNMAEGTSYGIVPYMIPTELAIVSAVVGAGGTFGAVIATWAFYKQCESTLLALKLHSFYVGFWALTCFVMKWDHLGSMFGGPKTQDLEYKDPVKRDTVVAKNEKFEEKVDEEQGPRAGAAVPPCEQEEELTVI
jgi:NNP family nitrate/nitrite transporter-like MFS transporter